MNILTNLNFKMMITLFVVLMYIPQHNSVDAADEDKGKFLGGMSTVYPDWFKESFLDLREDVEEATGQGKRLAIFFHQDGCPYCNALVERNFAQKDITDKAQKNFDIIALNMWGDRLITHIDGKQYTEKSFAEALKIQFTPTMIFYDEQGKDVLRVNGYHGPQRFNLDLDYAAGHHESEMTYRQFMKANRPKSKSSKELYSKAFFKKHHDYSNKSMTQGRPFAVFFEQKDCPACEYLHTQVLPDEELLNIINQFDNSQLDMWSKTAVITPEGEKITARQWATKLNIKFAPTVVIFNKEGQEVIRSEAFFKVFHTQGMFHYVLSDAYKNQPSFQRFLSEYADHFIEQGRDINIWR